MRITSTSRTISRARTLTVALLLASLLVGLDATAQQPTGQPAGQPASKPLSAEQIAVNMQKFYNETKDFQATFRQTHTELAAGEKKVSIGKVYFKKPGKMRWDYYDTKKKRERVMVSDGDVLWIYETKFKQVFKRCLNNSKLPAGLRFLMGEGDLKKDFTISLTKKSSPKLPEIRLVPKKATSRYKELRFVVDPGTFQVLKTTLYDPYGNTNEIVFKKPRTNSGLPDSGFKFTPPKSARIINQEKCAPAKK